MARYKIHPYLEFTKTPLMRPFHMANYHGELRHFAPENRSPSWK